MSAAEFNARVAKLEAQLEQRRGVLTLQDADAESELAEFVASSRGSNGQRWIQQPGESLAALIERIGNDAQVANLVVCTDRELPRAVVVRRSYGTKVQRFSHRQFMTDLFRGPDAPAVPQP